MTSCCGWQWRRPTARSAVTPVRPCAARPCARRAATSGASCAGHSRIASTLFAKQRRASAKAKAGVRSSWETSACQGASIASTSRATAAARALSTTSRATRPAPAKSRRQGWLYALTVASELGLQRADPVPFVRGCGPTIFQGEPGAASLAERESLRRTLHRCAVAGVAKRPPGALRRVTHATLSSRCCPVPTRNSVIPGLARNAVSRPRGTGKTVLTSIYGHAWDCSGTSCFRLLARSHTFSRAAAAHPRSLETPGGVGERCSRARKTLGEGLPAGADRGLSGADCTPRGARPSTPAGAAIDTLTTFAPYLPSTGSLGIARRSRSSRSTLAGGRSSHRQC